MYLHQPTELILRGNWQKIVQQLAVPTMIAMVLGGLNTFLDSVFVGQMINETAVAGVGVAYPLAQITLALGSWLGVGAAALQSIAIGAKEQSLLPNILGNVTILSLLLFLFFAVPCYFFAEDLVKMMGVSGSVLTEGVLYFKVTLLGAFFWIYGVALNFIVKGEGKTKEAAQMIAYALVVNVVLTPIFIQFLGLGVAGAAWATNIGMVVYVLLGLRFFYTKSFLKFDKQYFRLEKEVTSKILTVGLSAFIVSFMSFVQALLVCNVVADFGDNELAFFTACHRVYLLMTMPLLGLMQALQPVIGVNFGAGNVQRVKDGFWFFVKVGIGIVFPFWLGMLIFPEQVLTWVLPDMSLSIMDLQRFRVYIALIPTLSLIYMAIMLFPSIGQSLPATVLGLTRQLIFFIPVLWLLPKWMGIDGVYWGITLIDLVVLIVTIFWVTTTLRKLQPKETLKPILEKSNFEKA